MADISECNLLLAQLDQISQDVDFLDPKFDRQLAERVVDRIRYYVLFKPSYYEEIRLVVTDIDAIKKEIAALIATGTDDSERLNSLRRRRSYYVDQLFLWIRLHWRISQTRMRVLIQAINYQDFSPHWLFIYDHAKLRSTLKSTPGIGGIIINEIIEARKAWLKRIGMNVKEFEETINE
jgi:hypothetical protein